MFVGQQTNSLERELLGDLPTRLPGPFTRSVPVFADPTHLLYGVIGIGRRPVHRGVIIGVGLLHRAYCMTHEFVRPGVQVIERARIGRGNDRLAPSGGFKQRVTPPLAAMERYVTV